MGPYSEQKQEQRHETLKNKSEDESLSDDIRNIYKKKLNGLAVNEEEYNARVVEIYKTLNRGEFAIYER